jgi:hypothetical protein
MRADENKEQFHSYYKLTEEDLEEITKDWSVDLLIPADPKLESLEATHKEKNTPRTSRRRKTKEVQALSSALGKTTSISPNRGDDDEV